MQLCFTCSINESVGSEVPKFMYYYFPNGCPHLNFGVKNMKSNIAFSKCGNFIVDVITDWRKVDFETNTLKVLESGQNIRLQ